MCLQRRTCLLRENSSIFVKFHFKLIAIQIENFFFKVEMISVMKISKRFTSHLHLEIFFLNFFYHSNKRLANSQGNGCWKSYSYFQFENSISKLSNAFGVPSPKFSQPFRVLYLIPWCNSTAYNCLQDLPLPFFRIKTLYIEQYRSLAPCRVWLFGRKGRGG